jgi:hypothetical protein
MPTDSANIVYSSHVYSNKGTDWENAFGNLAETVPVNVGEFGGEDTPDDLDFVSKLVAYLQARDIVWAARSWFNDPTSAFSIATLNQCIRSMVTTSPCGKFAQTIRLLQFDCQKLLQRPRQQGSEFLPC